MTEQRRPTLEPVRVDAVRVAAIGTGCWLIAVVVLLFVRPADSWLWTALAGSGLGLLGMPIIAMQRRAAARHGVGNTDR